MPTPHVPPLSDLIREWQVCEAFASHRKGFCLTCEQRQRTYRLLVDWLRDDKFLGARINALPGHLQGVALKELPPAPAEMVSSLPKRYRSADRRTQFLKLLVLAWCIRQADHERVAAIPKARRLLKELGEYGADTSMLLDLTYLPEEIPEIIPAVLAFSADERQRRRLDVLSYRQNIAQGREAELQEDIPSDADMEARWASQFGSDKQTEKSSRQIIWDWLFVPLTCYLQKHLAGRKTDLDPSDNERAKINSDIVFTRASTLIYLRYPHLWEDRWSRVRDRWRYYSSPSLPS